MRDCRQDCRQENGRAQKCTIFSRKTAKTALYHSIKCGNLAESQGFEPWRRSSRLHDFQSCAFDHSANSPCSLICSRRGRKILYPINGIPSSLFPTFLKISPIYFCMLTIVQKSRLRKRRRHIFTSGTGSGLPYTAQSLQQHRQTPAHRC